MKGVRRGACVRVYVFCDYLETALLVLETALHCLFLACLSLDMLARVGSPHSSSIWVSCWLSSLASNFFMCHEVELALRRMCSNHSPMQTRQPL